MNACVPLFKKCFFCIKQNAIENKQNDELLQAPPSSNTTVKTCEKGVSTEDDHNILLAAANGSPLRLLGEILPLFKCVITIKEKAKQRVTFGECFWDNYD